MIIIMMMIMIMIMMMIMMMMIMVTCGTLVNGGGTRRQDADRAFQVGQDLDDD